MCIRDSESSTLENSRFRIFFLQELLQIGLYYLEDVGRRDVAENERTPSNSHDTLSVERNRHFRSSEFSQPCRFSKRRRYFCPAATDDHVKLPPCRNNLAFLY